MRDHSLNLLLGLSQHGAISLGQPLQDWSTPVDFRTLARLTIDGRGASDLAPIASLQETEIRTKLAAAGFAPNDPAQVVNAIARIERHMSDANVSAVPDLRFGKPLLRSDEQGAALDRYLFADYGNSKVLAVAPESKLGLAIESSNLALVEGSSSKSPTRADIAPTGPSIK